MNATSKCFYGLFLSRCMNKTHISNQMDNVSLMSFVVYSIYPFTCCHWLASMRFRLWFLLLSDEKHFANTFFSVFRSTYKCAGCISISTESIRKLDSCHALALQPPPMFSVFVCVCNMRDQVYYIIIIHFYCECWFFFSWSTFYIFGRVAP